MLPLIFIPTMGRKDKQHTYNLLPKFLQSRVCFVVRDFERDFFKKTYPKALVATCPHWVYNIATTRAFIQSLAKDNYHWVMDDDLLSFYWRPFNPTSEQPWCKTPATEQHWKQVCSDIWDKIKEGYGLVTFTSTERIPSSKRAPFAPGLCGTQWFCMNGKLMNKVEWDAINLVDDFDGCLQAISQGIKVGRFECWVHQAAPYGADGGCKEDRDVKSNNEAIDELITKWPKYARPARQGKNCGSSTAYGTEMKKARMYFIQAYKDHAHLRV